MEAERCVQVFKDAVAKYGKPDTINSDQSSQYTGIKWSQYVEEDLKIKRSTDGKGRLWKTIKYDYIYLLPADDYFEFFKGVKTTSATITRKSIRP